MMYKINYEPIHIAYRYMDSPLSVGFRRVCGKSKTPNFKNVYNHYIIIHVSRIIMLYRNLFMDFMPYEYLCQCFYDII